MARRYPRQRSNAGTDADSSFVIVQGIEKVSGCVVLGVQDPFTSQAAEEQPGVAADAAGSAAQNAAAAGHRPSATAAALAFRARQTGGQPTTRLWPIKCRVEAAGPTFRYVSLRSCLIGANKHVSVRVSGLQTHPPRCVGAE